MKKNAETDSYPARRLLDSLPSLLIFASATLDAFSLLVVGMSLFTFIRRSGRLIL